MRKRAGVIVYCASENRVLLIYRKKKTEQYWVIPGGGLEANESFEEAAKRELMEELGLPVLDLSEFCTISLTDSIEHYFISNVNNCKELKIQGEELQKSNVNNVFEPTWIDISELHAKRILPDELKRVLIDYLSTISKNNCD